MARKFICSIRVNLTMPDAEIIRRATEHGRNAGLDEDWTPRDLNEAVAEIIMTHDAPVECGVEIEGAEEGGAS